MKCDRGEQAAAAMEKQLTALEQKIDALLESAEAQGSADAEAAGHEHETMNNSSKSEK